jgi:hypothetical protein
VEEHELGLTLAPAQAAQLAQPVDGEEEPRDRGDLDLEAELLDVLPEERELVVVERVHVAHRRAAREGG